MSEYQQGWFKPKFPEKYQGDPTNIIYRSGWELKVLQYLDTNPNVLSYASEEIAIPYFDAATQRRRRYFPDFIIKARKNDGSIQTMMLEVKPLNQVHRPKKRKSKRYITEAATWVTNVCKWREAIQYCRDRDWEFIILTKDKAQKFISINESELSRIML